MTILNVLDTLFGYLDPDIIDLPYASRAKVTEHSLESWHAGGPLTESRLAEEWLVYPGHEQFGVEHNSE